MVAKELIEEIRSRLNLVTIVGQVVPLKKSGRNHAGRCPFHQEKTPSFTVSEEKQLYHCFGCGAGGTVYNFLMNYHQISFPEALERAAEMAGIEIKNRSEAETQRIRQAQEKKRRLIGALTVAAEAYHKYFLNSASAQKARTYAKGRSMDSKIAKDYMIGYAPDSWDTLSKFLASKGLPLDDAKEAGLVGAKKGGGTFDFFRDRLMFPIRDPEGKVIGLGGRVMGDATPKYLNSPQSPVFDKGKNLYGLFEAKDAIRVAKSVFVVEGYTDQIAMFTAGFQNTVATLGTALTQDHARLLKKYTDRVTLLFDGDAAGLKAVLRAMVPILEEGLSAYVISIPDRDDPDSYLRKHGAAGFRGLIEKEQPVMRFYLEKYYLEEKDVAKKAATVSQLVGMVRGANAYMKEALIRDIKDFTGLSEGILRGEEAPPRERRPAPVRAPAPRPAAANEFLDEELTLLRMAAESAEARDWIEREDVFALFSSPRLAEVSRGWIAAAVDASPSPSDWIDRWEDEATRAQLARAFMSVAPDFAAEWRKVYADCATKLKHRKIGSLTRELRGAEESGDAGRVVALSREVLELKKSSEKSKLPPQGRS